MDVPEELTRFVPQHDVLRLNLKAMPSQSLVASGQPVGWALSVMQQEDAPFDDFSAALRRSISQLEPLEGISRAHWEQLMYFLVLLIYHRRGEPERQPLLQLVQHNLQDLRHREEVTQMGLTAAEFIRQQTQQRERQQILTELMEIKFGTLPTQISQAIQAIADAEKLRTLLHRIPIASSLAEMENLLNGSTP